MMSWGLQLHGYVVVTIILQLFFWGDSSLYQITTLKVVLKQVLEATHAQNHCLYHQIQLII